MLMLMESLAYENKTYAHILRNGICGELRKYFDTIRHPICMIKKDTREANKKKNVKTKNINTKFTQPKRIPLAYRINYYWLFIIIITTYTQSHTVSLLAVKWQLLLCQISGCRVKMSIYHSTEPPSRLMKLFSHYNLLRHVSLVYFGAVLVLHRFADD